MREVWLAARDIVATIGTTRAIPPRTGDSLSYSMVRELWLRLAQRYAASDQGGPTWTERCVMILLQAAQWLAVEERIDRPLVVRKTRREQMRREWEQLTATRILRSTPRHSEDKIRQSFAQLYHPEVDLRIALPSSSARRSDSARPPG